MLILGIKGYTALVNEETSVLFTDTGDVFDDDIFLGYDCRMQHLSLMRSRSRRPLSVDDVRVAEEFLTKSSLDNDYKLCGDDSGFFSPSSLSSSSFSSSEKTWMSPPGTFISGFFNTQKPTAKKRLYSYPEGTFRELLVC